jgi:hypothetical protein
MRCLFVDEGQGKAYLARYGKGTKGSGWYSFDDHGVHFVTNSLGLVPICPSDQGRVRVGGLVEANMAVANLQEAEARGFRSESIS